MAAEEFGGKVNGKPIEIIAGDHQNKPDLGASIANRWFDVDKVDAITDLVNSAVAFAVLDITKQKNKTLLLTGAGSADFTGKACAPDNVVHWVYDTYEIGNAIGRTVSQLGNKWFLSQSTTFSAGSWRNRCARRSKRNGGTVVGSLRHPLGTSDFSSYIMQAKASGADVVAILNGGDDTINAIKTAKEFGLFAKQKVMPITRFAAIDQVGRPRDRTGAPVRLGLGAQSHARKAGPSWQSSLSGEKWRRARSTSAPIRRCAAISRRSKRRTAPTRRPSSPRCVK